MSKIHDSKQRVMNAALELIWEHSYGTTSVDAICAKAEVKKGSFYHFFESKSDLAVEAIEVDWQSRKPLLDGIFSPSTPPLERIANYFDSALKCQMQAKEACGSVLGCPLFSLGCEVSTQDPAISAKVREILDHHRKYFESAIRDAHAQGLLVAPDAQAKAKAVFAYYQGTVTQARIENSLAPIQGAKAIVFELLGVGTAAAA